MESSGPRTFLVSFVEGPSQDSRLAIAGATSLRGTPKGVRQELQYTISRFARAEEELWTTLDKQAQTKEQYAITVADLESVEIEFRALNEQLRATAAENKTAAEDFQNILRSSGIPTLILDENLIIRFFTESARYVVDLTTEDIGRRVADIAHKFHGFDLFTSCSRVFSNFSPVEQEIKIDSGNWYSCRIVPYRETDGQVKGVVIKFIDITELKQTEAALNVEKARAEAANVAKSRFLAAASHDLRQPLQTLRILQEILLRKITESESRELVTSSLSALTAMTGLLNTLLDINQLEAGVIYPELVNVSVAHLFQRLHTEFSFHASGKGLELRVVSCHLVIRSDPRLLEDMIRNLLANAVKYTRRGRILVGCRRRRGKLRIEVWDTGLGIPQGQLQAIFREFHQLENATRGGSAGLGLGLAIVQRLAALLEHRVEVRSRVGHGSNFSIEVPLAEAGATVQPEKTNGTSQNTVVHNGKILIVEDDPDVRRSYELLLRADGYRTIAVADGDEAILRVLEMRHLPDLVIVDYNLPGEWNGVDLATKLREQTGHNLPALVLTGDISIDTLREISKKQFIQRTKPVDVDDLRDVVQSLLAAATVVATAENSRQ
jgi:two-component system CheB/CheR fusion protein